MAGNSAPHGLKANGRYAPSPTATLHLGNLRTAFVAYLAAKAQGAQFLLRIEDMDEVACRPEHAQSAMRDLQKLGLLFDGDIMWQSQRRDAYSQVIHELLANDLLYPCYCTRREVLAEAESSVFAPHSPKGAYSGTCRVLSTQQRKEKEAQGRKPSLRLRGNNAEISFIDRLFGEQTGLIDDFVVQRADGTPAYNLAVVLDDAAQQVGEVVRGEDLLETTPRQIYLQKILNLPEVSYLHVPLVLGADGERLAKRHGSVTLAEQEEHGVSAERVRQLFAISLGLCSEEENLSLDELCLRFSVEGLPTTPWQLPAELTFS